MEIQVKEWVGLGFKARVVQELTDTEVIYLSPFLFISTFAIF